MYSRNLSENGRGRHIASYLTARGRRIAPTIDYINLHSEAKLVILDDNTLECTLELPGYARNSRTRIPNANSNQFLCKEQCSSSKTEKITAF